MNAFLEPSAPRELRGYGLSVKSWMIDGGVLVFRVRGIVTPQVGDVLVGHLRSVARQHRPAAVVSNYRAAVMCADARTMDAIVARNEYDEPQLEPPAAVVVSPAELDLWRDFAWLSAQRGRWRGVFTDGVAALAWLRAKARLWRVARST